MRGAVFFDRDGVLNVNHGWVHRREDFEWIEGSREAIRAANDAGLLVVVVTNQAGIAKGFYDEAAFHALMRWVDQELAAVGARIDAVYFCPHHPDFGAACDCRKPLPGMLLRAIDEHGIDPAASVLIGDSESDLQAAEGAGVRGVRFEGGNVLARLQETGAL